MHRLLKTLFFIFSFYALHGQTLFSILPDVGGINMQAMGFTSIPDSADIVIIGHRYDTILPGPNTKPFLAHINYNGEFNGVVPVLDSLYQEPFFFLYSIQPVKINDSIYYYEGIRNTGDTYLKGYIAELNIKSGTILRSSIISNDNYPHLPYEPHVIKVISKNKLLLLNTLIKGDSAQTYFVFLDSMFNVKKVIRIKELSVKSNVQACKVNSDGSFDLVGYCFVDNKIEDDYYTYYQDRIDSSGNVLQHVLAPTSIPIWRGVYGTNTVLQDLNGNWIIGGTYFEDLPDLCDNCYQLVPYIFSTTSDFKTLRWQTRFFDIPDYEAPQYFLYSITQASDGYIVAGDFENYNGYDSGVLFKSSNNGDSLWMKHYIPLDWDEDRVGSVRFHNIMTSPFKTIIVTGAVVDVDEQIIRPWILQLDEDGCLVPGCNTVATHEINNAPPQDNFTIYPNPASSEIYVLSKITSTDPLNISIISNNGTELKKRNFSPVEGYQYALSVNDLA